MNIFKSILLIILSFGFTISKATSQDQPEQNFGLQIFSTYLKDSIPYKVILPEDFQTKKDNLDLLILLDGDEYSGIADNTIALYEYSEKVNPTLIISLPSTAESRWAQYTPTKAKGENDPGNADVYALTGKFNDFADFIK